MNYQSLICGWESGRSARVGAGAGVAVTRRADEAAREVMSMVWWRENIRNESLFNDAQLFNWASCADSAGTAVCTFFRIRLEVKQKFACYENSCVGSTITNIYRIACELCCAVLIVGAGFVNLSIYTCEHIVYKNPLCLVSLISVSLQIVIAFPQGWLL